MGAEMLDREAYGSGRQRDETIDVDKRGAVSSQKPELQSLVVPRSGPMEGSVHREDEDPKTTCGPSESPASDNPSRWGRKTT